MKYGIALGTYDNLSYVKQWLESLFRYSSKKHSIVIVFDGCGDPYVNAVENTAKELSERYKYVPELLHLRKIPRTGICGTRNEGARILFGLGYEYMLLMSDDQVLAPGWDKDVHEYMNHETVIIANQVSPREGIVLPPPELFDWERWECIAVKFRQERLMPAYLWGEHGISLENFRRIGGWPPSMDKVNWGITGDKTVIAKLRKLGIEPVKVGTYVWYHYGAVTVKKVGYKAGYHKDLWDIPDEHLPPREDNEQIFTPEQVKDEQ